MIVILLVIAVGVFFFTRLNSASMRAVAQEGENRDSQAKIRDALVNFVGANGYLPCPANGTSATGLAVPATANPICTNSDGVVPWATLGLSSTDVTDPYQNKISYRVFSGATGLTQPNGASMVNCDPIRNSSSVPPTVGTDATGLCRIDHNTSQPEFLAGKGFTVTDSGTPVASVAFVLISHGKNGAGAYRANGGQNPLPISTSSEYGHTQANGPFVIKAANTAGLAPTDTNYFDDTLTYLTISDLAGRAKVAARSYVVNSTTFTAANVAAAAAAAGATPQGTSTNASTLTINNIVISSSSSGGGAREISSLGGTSGFGIGVISTSSTTGGTISGSDVLTLAFGSTGQRLGLMFVDFGSVSGQAEQAQLVFKNGTAIVLTTTVISCRSGSQLASYDINVGADFDHVELSALPRVASSTSSNFLLSEIALCSSAAFSCATASANAITACPYP